MGESLLFHSNWLIPYIKVMPGYFLSFETFVLFAQAPDEGAHRHIQWAHMGVCNGQTDFALTLTRKLWLPHFRTFCELVEGEENKLTTFSTWTIMLGCNESNIIFQQHLCKLGQLRKNIIFQKQW